VAAEPVAPHRTAAAAIVRELSNLIATQAASHVREGVYLWGSGNPRDSLVEIMVLEASATGWSALALHRADPGVRCAVVVGSAAPLFNAPQGRERPYCVAEDGRSVHSGAVPDSTWVFWWSDELLDAVPEQLSCPPLKIPKLPKRNDSVYVTFVVGRDGTVEPGGIAIESTGDLDASVAALVRLAGCTFRPATFQGASVRAIMRHHIGLAPSRPEPPPPLEPFTGDSLGPSQPMTAMRAALEDVAAAQRQRYADRGTYAAAAPDLDIERHPDPAVRVVMLSWGPAGWSAVAFHDSTEVRCAVAVGDGAAPGSANRSGTPGCTSAMGRTVVDTTASDNRDAPDPPQPRSCNTRLQFRDNPTRRVRVTFEFIVGTDGKPEPRSLRILEGTGLVDAAGALQVLATCSYRPGRDHGKPIRVLVRQPIAFN